jgi:hypothetical protein
MNPTVETLATCALPEVIITSKPDVYDATGSVAGYVKSKGFIPVNHFMAFTTWVRR